MPTCDDYRAAGASSAYRNATKLVATLFGVDPSYGTPRQAFEATLLRAAQQNDGADQEIARLLNAAQGEVFEAEADIAWWMSSVERLESEVDQLSRSAGAERQALLTTRESSAVQGQEIADLKQDRVRLLEANARLNAELESLKLRVRPPKRQQARSRGRFFPWPFWGATSNRPPMH
jgi:chromosome segregation ATPase